jgi:predicted RND superfamily exporter protein
LLITHTNFSVSSGVGFLALFGVSVQTGVIMLEYINQLRARGYTIEEAAVEGAVLRFRPIMMTMLVATWGLLPAALSHGIGSDSQRPFAIVIVGGLISDLVMSIFCCRRSMPGSRTGAIGCRSLKPERSIGKAPRHEKRRCLRSHQRSSHHPAIRVSRGADAHFAAEAVCRGGIPIVEITMTVPGAVE